MALFSFEHINAFLAFRDDAHFGKNVGTYYAHLFSFSPVVHAATGENHMINVAAQDITLHFREDGSFRFSTPAWVNIEAII
jgi:hypothetical protein